MFYEKEHRPNLNANYFRIPKSVVVLWNVHIKPKCIKTWPRAVPVWKISPFRPLEASLANCLLLYFFRKDVQFSSSKYTSCEKRFLVKFRYSPEVPNEVSKRKNTEKNMREIDSNCSTVHCLGVLSFLYEYFLFTLKTYFNRYFCSKPTCTFVRKDLSGRHNV